MVEQRFVPAGDFLPLLSFLTHARATGAVQGQALGALAAEGALSVHALAVCANAGEDFTLVDVCRNSMWTIRVRRTKGRF